jgi:hypothetical protein
MGSLYGFYSAKQAASYGSFIWRHADGSEVEVTEVGSNTTYTGCWPDMKCIGEVLGFIRDGVVGLYSPMHILPNPLVSPTATYPGYAATTLDFFPIVTITDGGSCTKSSIKKNNAPTLDPDVKAWRNDQPGQCACGIAKQDCDYHR